MFISHTGQDAHVEQLVSDLHGCLVNHRVRVFFDAATIPSGDTWRKTILKWVKRSKVVVVVLSPAFPTRKWPLRELSIVMANTQGRCIFPVLLGVTHEDLDRAGTTRPTKLGARWVKAWQADRELSELNPLQMLKALKEHQAENLNKLVAAGGPSKNEIMKAAADVSEKVRRYL